MNNVMTAYAHKLAMIRVPLRNDQTAMFQGQPPAAVGIQYIPSMVMTDIQDAGVTQQATNSNTQLIGQY